MIEDFKKFAEMLSADEKAQAELNEKIAGKDEKEQKEIIKAFAKEKGFEFNTELTTKGNELDENELSQVYGGQDCVCIFGGNGHHDGCICPFAGVGEECMCAYIGYGSDI